MGFYMTNPDFASPPLQYTTTRTYGGAEGANTTLLLILGAVAVMLILSQQQQSLHHRIPYALELPRPQAIANGIASMATTVAAQIGDVVAGGTARKAAEVLSTCESAPTVELIDAKKATKAAPDASKEMSDTEKFANAKELRAWIAKHPKGVVVLFAHWCPHCKAMIAQLAEVAKGAPKDVAFLACNAEAVAGEAFAGDDAVVELEYYPTVCKITKGTVEQVADVQAGVEALAAEEAESPAEAAAEEPAAEAPEPAAEDGGENATDASTDASSTAEMLNMLF